MESVALNAAPAVGIAPAPPIVSVVIPAYNCASTIGAAVSSCLDQTCDRVEVIVVNDGSTDGTLGVLEAFGTRIRVISQPNGGLAAARNAGTRAARGRYVAWMDGDDLANAARFEIQAAVLDAHASVDLVCSDFSAFVDAAHDYETSHIGSYYGSVKRLGGMAKIFSRTRALQTRPGQGPVYTVRSDHVYEQLVWGNFVHPPTVMVRRSVFDKAGYFNEALRYNSDYALLLKIARHGEVAFVDAPLLRYRRSANQMSHAAAGGRIPLETAWITEQLQHEDPELFSRHRAAFRKRIALARIEAAEAIGGSDRLRALGLLARALLERPVVRPALRAFARIVVPRPVVVALKRLRTGATAGVGVKLALLDESGWLGESVSTVALALT